LETKETDWHLAKFYGSSTENEELGVEEAVKRWQIDKDWEKRNPTGGNGNRNEGGNVKQRKFKLGRI
jgi:hypothetical protein